MCRPERTVRLGLFEQVNGSSDMKRRKTAVNSSRVSPDMYEVLCLFKAKEEGTFSSV